MWPFSWWRDRKKRKEKEKRRKEEEFVKADESREAAERQALRQQEEAIRQRNEEFLSKAEKLALESQSREAEAIRHAAEDKLRQAPGDWLLGKRSIDALPIIRPGEDLWVYAERVAEAVRAELPPEDQRSVKDIAEELWNESEIMLGRADAPHDTSQYGTIDQILDTRRNQPSQITTPDQERERERDGRGR